MRSFKVPEFLKASHGQKGIAAQLITALILTFFIIMVWVVMSKVYVVELFPVFEVELQNFTNATKTFNILKGIWDFWPILPVVALWIWVIASASKRESDAIRF